MLVCVVTCQLKPSSASRLVPAPATNTFVSQAGLMPLYGVAEAEHIAYAFPELRCTFGDRSIVPDIAVFRWENIILDEQGEPFDNVLAAPDWVIEILSLDQSPNRVTGHILHCLKHGCRLGWLIDPGDRSVVIFQPQQQLELFCQEDRLLVLEGVELALTAKQLFRWLNMKAD